MRWSPGTDKATMDVPRPAAGVVKELVAVGVTRSPKAMSSP